MGYFREVDNDVHPIFLRSFRETIFSRIFDVGFLAGKLGVGFPVIMRYKLGLAPIYPINTQ